MPLPAKAQILSFV